MQSVRLAYSIPGHSTGWNEEDYPDFEIQSLEESEVFLGIFRGLESLIRTISEAKEALLELCYI